MGFGQPQRGWTLVPVHGAHSARMQGLWLLALCSHPSPSHPCPPWAPCPGIPLATLVPCSQGTGAHPRNFWASDSLSSTGEPLRDQG